MQQPFDQRTIRPEFVIVHLQRQKVGWANRTAMVDARNTKHQDLNRSYGIRDEDGSIPMGQRSHSDPEYSRRYDAIEAEFKPCYEGTSIEERRADRAEGMTIFEYLLLEDIVMNADEFIENANRNTYVDFISLKAKSEVRRQAAGRTVIDAQKVVSLLIYSSQFAGKRCREYLAIKPWNITAQLTIAAYQRRYKACLREAADNLRFSIEQRS